MAKWQFYDTKANILDDKTANIIHNVYKDGFGVTDGWSIDGIKNKMYANSDIMGLLKADNNEVIGYSFYEVPNEKIDGMYMLWINGISLKKSIQHGVALRSIYTDIPKYFPNKKFGYIGARTQNPEVISMLIKIGYNFPMAEGYFTKKGQNLMSYLLRNIHEANTIEKLNSSRGIGFGVYSSRSNYEYAIAKNHTEIEKKLKEFGFERQNGDVILLVSKLKKIIG